jgi:formylglycine-generating enzyme
MRPTKISILGSAVLAGIAFSPSAFAVVNIDYVPVGHAGNAADPATGRGSVAYAYNIGKYEVTNAQYTEFLNAVDPTGANPNGIYNSFMGSNLRGGITYTAGAASGTKYTIRTSMGDKPVNYVSWYDAARFTNWLHNGQGSGDTETGAYTLTGNTGMPTRNVGATVYLPSDAEWYKAAYYDPTAGAGGGDNYWAYTTQSDTAPTVATANATGDVSNPGTNVANYNNGADWNSLDGNVTTVGGAAANNYFGTADQGGNLAEWTQLISGSNRGRRGGSWLSPETGLAATTSVASAATGESFDIGFRVASIPEPSAVLLGGLGLLMVMRRRR